MIRGVPGADLEELVDDCDERRSGSGPADESATHVCQSCMPEKRHDWQSAQSQADDDRT
jgi:hypothetical protein